MRRHSRFGGDSRAVAAMEFALVAPMLVVMLIGMMEVTSLVRANIKLNHAVGLLGKMVAQQASPITAGTSNTLGNLCTGAALAMTPMPTATFAAAVASVTTSASGSSQATSMDWESDTSCATAATAIGSATAVSLANTNGLVPDVGDSAIIVKVSYSYASPTHLFLSASTVLTQTIFVRPRINATIACSNC